MRIIQSTWACNNPDLLQTNSGWLSPEYNLMSWALSCLQLKQYYPELVLYCDSVYAKMLIDTLELPYSDVVCNLDVLNNYHPQLWALPKIYSYSQQEKPFLHVDGDVFIWKKFSNQILNSNLLAQNIETATDYYEKIMVSLESGLIYFPNEIINERRKKNPIIAYNAGILGGSDISFFKEYASKAFEFVDKNTTNLSKINVTNFNIFFEQYLFYCLATKNKKHVEVLITEPIKDNQYKGFGDFVKVPYEKTYLHLLGAYKRNELVCKQLADRLRQDYPVYYYRIIELIKNNKISLHKDYYYYLENYSEKYLLERYHDLKNKFLKKEELKVETSINLNSGKEISYTYFATDLQILSLDEGQLKDLQAFVCKINKIKKSRFLHISKDTLYGRNSNSNYYFEYLFENMNSIYEKKILADSDFEIIESEYDWCTLRDENKKGIKNAPLKKGRLLIKTIITAECDCDGFHLEIIDELDILLLEILKNVKTVEELLDGLREYFDEAELSKSPILFEKLIFGRIKMGLQAKYIKVNFLTR